jgi:hypothetical protein
MSQDKKMEEEKRREEKRREEKRLDETVPQDSRTLLVVRVPYLALLLQKPVNGAGGHGVANLLTAFLILIHD